MLLKAILYVQWFRYNVAALYSNEALLTTPERWPLVKALRETHFNKTAHLERRLTTKSHLEIKTGAFWEQAQSDVMKCRAPHG